MSTKVYETAKGKTNNNVRVKAKALLHKDDLVDEMSTTAAVNAAATYAAKAPAAKDPAAKDTGAKAPAAKSPAVVKAPTPAKSSSAPFRDMTKVPDLDIVTTAVEEQKKKLDAWKKAIEENEPVYEGNLEHLNVLVTAKRNADAQAKRKQEAEEAKKRKREAEEKAKKEDEERELKRAKILERMKRAEEELKALETPSTAAVSPNPSESGQGKGKGVAKKCAVCHRLVTEHSPMQRQFCADVRKEKQAAKEAKEAKKVEKPEKDDKTSKPKTPRAALAKVAIPKKPSAAEKDDDDDSEAARIVKMQEDASNMIKPARAGPGKGKTLGGPKPPVENLVSGSESGDESEEESSSQSSSEESQVSDQ